MKRCFLVEDNIEQKSTEIKTEKKKLEQVTYNLGDFAIGAGGVLWVLGSMFKKEGTEL